MNPSARFALGCLLAVALPAAFLHFSAEDDRLAAGLTTSPFGWPRLLVAHLVTALPLGYVAAQRLRLFPAVNAAAPALWVVSGLGLAGLATQIVPAIGDGVSGFAAEPLVFLRAGIAFVLVLPWCVWATDPPTGPASVKFGVLLGLGVAAAVVPCGVYAEAIGQARTKQVQELLQRERLVRADALLAGLVELGSERPVGGKSPEEVRKTLAAVLPRLRRDAERPLPANPKPAERLQFAALMIRLERLADAAAALEPLVPASDTATLLLATVRRDQERWAASDELFAGVLEKLFPAQGEPDSRAGCVTALSGLAFNAREDRRPGDAERVLKRGIELLPDHAADFHFQLGAHYQNAGRPALAVEHFRTAGQLEPAKHGEAATDAIRSLHSSTPACLLWRSP